MRRFRRPRPRVGRERSGGLLPSADQEPSPFPCRSQRPRGLPANRCLSRRHGQSGQDSSGSRLLGQDGRLFKAEASAASASDRRRRYQKVQIPEALGQRQRATNTNSFFIDCVIMTGKCCNNKQTIYLPCLSPPPPLTLLL